MAENVNALITNAGRIAALPTDTVVNLADGAQLGLGTHLPLIDAATPLVLPPIVAVVTHLPTMFKDDEGMNKTLKAMFERHAKEITGIDFQYTLEGAETPAGHDGQTLLMPTNARRTSVEPSFTWQEVAGNPIFNVIKDWIFSIKHPDTQASLLSALNVATTSATAAATPQLISHYTADICFIQFDPTMKPENIIDAFMITNIWPKETGMIGAQRTIGESKVMERTVTFAGIVQHNKNTKKVGMRLAEALGMHRVNYDLATPIATQVETLIAQDGLTKEVTASTAGFTLLA